MVFMIRYEANFNNEYFVEYFRKLNKYKNRICLPRENPKRPISVVTTCMNRITDIRSTLPENLKSNSDYPGEFILLDYGSQDGLGEWVQLDMKNELASNRLVYYRTEQDVFKPNHSRNISFKLASHELITNVDADNYTNTGFLNRLNELNSCSKLIILPESFLDPNSDRLNLRGRFAIHKNNIEFLGGFDESLDNGYSHDDVNFVFRAMLAGFNIARFEDKFLENRIETPYVVRTQLMKNKSLLSAKQSNARLTNDVLARCMLTANYGKDWGSATVVKNFSEEFQI